jgi:HEAT repeat protein
LPRVTSREAIRIDAGRDWIAAMELEETLVTRPAMGPAAEVSNRASLALRANGGAPDRQRWAFVPGTPVDAGVSDLPVPQLSLEDSREEISATIASLDLAVDVRAGHIHRLRDLLQMHPELPSMVLDALREDALGDRTRADLYLALQLAGTPEAQRVLNEVATDYSLSPQDGLRAIVALGSVRQPTDETLQQLWSTARAGPTDGEYRDLPTTATLALGTIGKGLRASGATDYQALRVDLLDSASSGSTANQRAAALLALGNTGDDDPALKNDIVPFLTDPEPGIRDAAANSLGRLGPDPVAVTLVDSYRNERSARVRGSIAKALVNWEQPSRDAVQTLRIAIEDEKDEKARYNLAVLLGNSMDAHPENRATLERLLETERSKRVRQQIADALYASP